MEKEEACTNLHTNNTNKKNSFSLFLLEDRLVPHDLAVQAARDEHWMRRREFRRDDHFKKKKKIYAKRLER